MTRILTTATIAFPLACAVLLTLTLPGSGAS